VYCCFTLYSHNHSMVFNNERNPYSKMSVKLLRAAANGTFYFCR